ncbi:MAG: hypothetical protein LJU34_04980, partial [Oscillospiraceae bacterium]|nr:hypothetical protein [Oscillospiraceae bacterium]
RTSIHKALTDESLLPVKVVHALADYFQLSIEERQHFFQLYDILFQGEDTWNERHAICQLLNRLSNISFHNVIPPCKIMLSRLPEKILSFLTANTPSKMR